MPTQPQSTFGSVTSGISGISNVLGMGSSQPSYAQSPATPSTMASPAMPPSMSSPSYAMPTAYPSTAMPTTSYGQTGKMGGRRRRRRSMKKVPRRGKTSTRMSVFRGGVNTVPPVPMHKGGMNAGFSPAPLMGGNGVVPFEGFRAGRLGSTLRGGRRRHRKSQKQSRRYRR